VSELIQEGKIPFTIEGRILRELGERLVKQPEIALLELIKNSYDADATRCSVAYDYPNTITVTDDGVGMTLAQFQNGWMRIGTSSKEAVSRSERFERRLTGEKGIGRFAVRFLGLKLELETVADDSDKMRRTRLLTGFDWAEFDRHEDLGEISVHYKLTAVNDDIPTGTTLTITQLRPAVAKMEWKQVATGSIGVVTPERALMPSNAPRKELTAESDPGFTLDLKAGQNDPADLSNSVLDFYVLKAVLRLERSRLSIDIFQGGREGPYLKVRDHYISSLKDVHADIRFFPRRPGTFAGAPIDGRIAYTWIKDNSGVLVFDRGFQVRPYGTAGDDWLNLVTDAARNRRHPRSSISLKHFPMTPEAQASPAENWMLRLPESAQLIGAVHVEGARTIEIGEEGLIAAADREGFLNNDAFLQLVDVVRGAVEAIAFADRQIQLETARTNAERRLETSRVETRTAIEQIGSDPNLTDTQKARIVGMLVESQERVERQEEGTKEREQQLEIMSLLGVIGGFMTHEFGIAITELRKAQNELDELAREHAAFKEKAASFKRHAEALESFVAYSRAYIQGARAKPTKPYAAKPRLNQVVRVFGQYAKDRRIRVDVDVEPDVMVPLLPAALYNGIAQNLFTNALKAVTAKGGHGERRIALRAWNDRKFHRLQVSDTGVGIPGPVRNKVFDPLFTTTESRTDPLGSGMGLGLALVRRSASAFGGTAELVEPPSGFMTCMEVRFPLAT
jgi:signal transduction histidine kinase